MKIKDGYILRKIAGEYVVIPSGEDLDLNMMISLNETGSFLWEKLTEGAEEEELVAALLAEYEVDQERARTAVAGFVARLRDNDFLA